MDIGSSDMVSMDMAVMEDAGLDAGSDAHRDGRVV